MSTLNELIKEVTQRFYEWIDRTVDPESNAFEAFKKILVEELPRDCKTLMCLASKHLFLATLEPTCGPTLSGISTPVGLVYAHLYEFLESLLWKELGSLAGECPSCYGEGVLHADGVPSIGCRKCWGTGEITN